MRVRMIPILAAVLMLGAISVVAQQPSQNTTEQPVSLSEPAVAFDSRGLPALEGTLKTTSLIGAADAPVTNIRLVVKNVGPISYGYVSGLVTFYDSSQIRCGEGVFKADVLALGESFETDTPGIRIRCSAASWRIVATNLLPRVSPGPASVETTAIKQSNFLISVDGEEHPIQLDKPMVLNVGERRRTIVVRRSP